MFRNTYIYMYIHVIYVYSNNQWQKEAMNLKEARRDTSEGLEGGKRREKCCNCIIISKLQKKISWFITQWQGLLLKTVCLCHQTRRNQTDAQREDSPLSTSTHGTEKNFACYWRRKLTIDFTQLQTTQPIAEHRTHKINWPNGSINVMGATNNCF